MPLFLSLLLLIGTIVQSHALLRHDIHRNRPVLRRSPILYDSKEDLNARAPVETTEEQYMPPLQDFLAIARSATSPELLSILLVYFVQGALGISRLAISFFLKDELHLSPSEMAALTGLTSLPWLIKPIYGFLSDGVPIFGYKRRSYLLIAGLAGSLSWLLLGTIVHDATSTLVAIIVGSASVAISDVVVDSIVVEKSRVLSNHTTTSLTGPELQSFCWGASAVGGIMSAYFSGSLLEKVSPKIVFLITAFFPLLISVASAFIDEKKSYNMPSKLIENMTAQFSQLKETVSNPSIYLPVLFVFLWQATPTPDAALFYFTTNTLGFNPEFLGTVRLFANIAALAGVVVYRTLLKDVSIKNIILWATLISVPLSLSQVILTSRYNLVLGIPDKVFALTDTVILTVLGQIAFMPTLLLASSLCPPGVEGALFATLMSIYNAAGTLSSELGAGLTELLGVSDNKYENLNLLVTICSLSSLLPLLFIDLLDIPSTKEND